jgi:hypothetical protein
MCLSLIFLDILLFLDITPGPDGQYYVVIDVSQLEPGTADDVGCTDNTEMQIIRDPSILTSEVLYNKNTIFKLM